MGFSATSRRHGEFSGLKTGLAPCHGRVFSCWLIRPAFPASGPATIHPILDLNGPMHPMLGFNGNSMNRMLKIAGGFIDYIRDSAPGRKWSPFNGQTRRREIFDALKAQDFAAIIETGTYLGTTTQYFAETGLPVFSIEGYPRRYGFVKARFLCFRNVSLRLGDTRSQLRKILAQLGPEICQKPLFFYLDAHWKKDLPLAD